LLIEWIDLENPKNIAERIKKVTGSQGRLSAPLKYASLRMTALVVYLDC
jgi:hypothetical protein